MSDAAFKTAAYPGYTTAELRAFVASYPKERGSSHPDYAKCAAIVRELVRREKANSGDTSVMTDGEKLRYARTGKAR